MSMANNTHAGQPAPPNDLINVTQFISQYYVLLPEVGNVAYVVTFSTSGHWGSAMRYSFNKAHILAIAQAIAEICHQQR